MEALTEMTVHYSAWCGVYRPFFGVHLHLSKNYYSYMYFLSLIFNAVKILKNQCDINITNGIAIDVANN